MIECKTYPIETAPKDTWVVVYLPSGDFRLDFYSEEDECWIVHSDSYEHYCAVACDGMTGPPEKPGYTHWCPVAPSPYV